MQKIITGLDIGTTKISACLAALTPEGKARILGIGSADAKGINKGFVSSLDKLVDSITLAVRAAEDKARVKAHEVVANISGASVAGRPSSGLIPLARRGREITPRDVRKAVEMTKAVSLTLEKDFLYGAVQGFAVDDNEGVENPAGLFGTKLNARMYVITAQATHIQNISKAVNYAGYELLKIIPTAVASAPLLLKEDEGAGGTLIADIGGGITELAVFRNGRLRFFDSINVGGMDLTSSLSAHFKIPFGSAESIKRKHGSILKEDLTKDQKNTFDVEDRRVVIDSDTMNNILKERHEEIAHILMERLNTSGNFTRNISSFMLTGGSALLSGASESLEELFKMPVKMARIRGIEGDPSILANPASTAAIGLARYGLENHIRTRPVTGKSLLTDVTHRIRTLLDEYF